MPTSPATRTQLNGNAAGCGCLVAVVVFAGILVAGYDLLDAWGWVWHSKAVEVYASGDWPVGDERSCLGIQSRLAGEAPAITSMDCRIEGSAEKVHQEVTDVRFFGETSRPDLLMSGKSDFEWRCRRTRNGFTCYALN